ncbi:hypothetical protein AMAG_02109 [Allomyces macrogynus ATCC 38327]|uniref:ABC transporter domain-containing protein n=1 Tax=Allomyces macrogynus (strain ATCC 38327) TaxID=578462 RepID=A0A0L0S157_ALLM3|nr:hypothetical protein AMAG_02109 [Allomyces macrogynus ATCC 38327]|eukprot:KNE56283.1 hypothetical protein AMAG_02109 [Allomyces macrogynus ATCC 38327]
MQRARRSRPTARRRTPAGVAASIAALLFSNMSTAVHGQSASTARSSSAASAPASSTRAPTSTPSPSPSPTPSVAAAVAPKSGGNLPPPTTGGSAASTNSTDIFDDIFSIKYFAGLFKLVPAPNAKVVAFANGTDNVCRFVSTPRNGTDAYDCPAGFFCPFGANKQYKCSEGFFCPANTAQPLYCCEGYYCPTSSTVVPCPEGSYCPRGSIRPFPCHVIASCPEGTIAPRRVGVLVVVAVFMVITSLIFALKSRRRSQRSLKYSESMATIHDSRDHHLFGNAAKQPMTLPRRGADPEKRAVFDIQFASLGLTLPNGAELLRGVSGELKAGRVCAIMGPSGSGKTTFINVLTGKVPRSDGSVSINGMEGELSHYQKLIGFVPQEDIMIRELTVLDTLMFSAKTRLPARWAHVQHAQKVLETIEYLGLSHVMNEAIGDEESRGISGGQRKRVNIGMELVAEPAVLFLDEPTSGLDSSTSYEVCTLLQSIARDQFITIGAVIHSPSPAAFERFDDLLLLAKGGRVAYFGERSFAWQYFKGLGYLCPMNVNQADFLLDVVSGKTKSDRYPFLTPLDLVHAWDRFKVGESPEPVAGPGNPTFRVSQAPGTLGELRLQFADMWLDAREFVKDVTREFFEWVISTVTCSRDPIRQTPGFLFLWWQCFRRASLQIYRTPAQFLVDQMLHLGCGAFISIASENIDYLGKQPQQICDIAPAALKPFCVNPIDNLRQVGVFMSLGVLFTGISVGATTFGNERVVYWRETAAGRPTLPYFLGKLIADIPRIVIAAFMFSLSLILFWPYRSHFLILYAVAALLYYTAFGMGYFLSIWVRKESVGLVGTGFALLWSMVLSGMIPSYETVRTSGVYDGIAWLWDISPPRYAVEALYVKEVQARPFPENQSDDQAYMYRISHFQRNLIIMFVIGTAWNVLALVSLRLAHRSRMK